MYKLLACLAITVCISTTVEAIRDRSGLIKPAQLKFSTRSGDCVLLQSYSPKDIGCTYCLCFPNNWYNCWTYLYCDEKYSPKAKDNSTSTASSANTSSTLSPIHINNEVTTATTTTTKKPNDISDATTSQNPKSNDTSIVNPS